MCFYIYVGTMLRVIICQGKSVNMSRSLLFHVFIYMCVYYVKSVKSLTFHVFIYMCVLC